MNAVDIAAMRINFLYGHGSGNAFPIIDARALDLGEDAWRAVARALSDRAGPVGSDGVLLLTAGDDGHAFGMRMFNSDGSEAETCLNGLRLVARLGFERLGIDHASVRLKTSEAEVTRAVDLAPGVFTVRERAGPASLDASAWPIRGEPKVIEDRIIENLSPTLEFTAVAMPNPHLVAFVECIDEAELVRIGEICDAAPDWLPNRANVSFIEIDGADLYVRTFERGVGLTDSCGSAMAASTVAAALTGRLYRDREVIVRNRGGLVRTRVDGDRMVTLSGNATFAWEGSAEVDVERGSATEVRVVQRFDAETIAWRTMLDAVGG